MSCRQCYKTFRGNYVEYYGDNYCNEECVRKCHGKKCWGCSKYFIYGHGLKKLAKISSQFLLNSLDTDSKLRHDTVRLSRTKHIDKRHAGLASKNQICLDESLFT